MNLSAIPLFDAIQAKLRWLEARQEAVARNIANADVPGYAAQDVKAIDFEKILAGQAANDPLKVTQPGHMKGRAVAAGTFRTVNAPDREVSPNGNSVVLEDQMLKLGETQMAHQLAIGVYSKAVDMMRKALK